MAPLKVFAGHDGGSGCAWYRMQMPLEELGKHDGFDVTFAAIGDYGGAQPQAVTARDLQDYDVIVAQRWNKHGGLGVWRQARTPFSRLVYDLDDDVFQIGPENWGAYSLYGRADIRDATAHAAETADLVTVSTPALAEVMREYNPAVAVLPNCLPDWVPDLPREPRARPRVGWMGGASHGLDIGEPAEPVRGFLKRFPGWDLHLGGSDYRPTYAHAGVPEDRMFYSPWVQVNTDPEGYYASVDFDIGLVPLVETPFSRSKSFLKCLEMNARGIPVLATFSEPYRDYVQDGVNGFLIRKSREWLERLCDLASDDRLREKMSAASRETARQHLIGDGRKMWADAYQGMFRR